MGKSFSRKQKAWAISDRSGFKFPLSEMVYEPGTKLFVHKSESDGKYSKVTHPSNNKGKFLKQKTISKEGFVKNAHPRSSIESSEALSVFKGKVFLNNDFYLSGFLKVGMKGFSSLQTTGSFNCLQSSKKVYESVNFNSDCTFNVNAFQRYAESFTLTGGGLLLGDGYVVYQNTSYLNATCNINDILSTKISTGSVTYPKIEGSAWTVITPKKVYFETVTQSVEGSLECTGIIYNAGNSSLNCSGSMTSSASIGSKFETYIAAVGDDGFEYIPNSSDPNTSYWNSASGEDDNLVVGTGYDHIYIMAVRFINISIPQGSTITSATITLDQADWFTDNPVQAIWQAWATDNAGQFSASTKPSGVPATVTSTSFQDTTEWYEPKVHDVTLIVQEMINRSGWSSGNAINFFATPTTSGSTLAEDKATSYAARSAYNPAAKLTILYA